MSDPLGGAEGVRSHRLTLWSRYRCGDNTCIPSQLMCDGFEDCSDGSDENWLLCTYGDSWQCRVLECVGDVTAGPPAGSRARAESPCAAHQQLCGDGRCVPAGAACAAGGTH